MRKVKLITFQSKEVLNELLAKGIYYANNSKSREKRDYSKDIESLGGHQPVWCFRVPEPLNIKDWYRGKYFYTYSCEMSLRDKKLKDFEMIELEVDIGLPVVGQTHNDYRHAVIIPYIKIEWLTMTYELSERYLLDAIGFPNAMPVVHFNREVNKNKPPLFENGFHTLSSEEFQEIEHLIRESTPLKAFKCEGDVDNMIAENYLEGAMTTLDLLKSVRPERKAIGFKSNKVSTNPLD